MSTFKNIQGKNIRSYANNAPNATAGEMWYNRTEQKLKGIVSIEATNSGTPMINRRSLYGFGVGTGTAGLVVGGLDDSTYLSAVEEYNGSGWAVGGAYPGARYGVGSAGTQTAAIAYCGRPPSTPTPAAPNETNNYNGSSWTSGNNFPTTGNEMQGIGAVNTAVVSTENAPSTAMHHWNGTSWTSANARNTAKGGQAAFGTQTAAVLAGGYPGESTQTELYNGTNWTTSSSLVTGANQIAGSGTQTDGLAFGGDRPPSEAAQTTIQTWDGTSWATSPATLATARTRAGTGRNTASGTWVAGGIGPGGGGEAFNATEEYNKSANVVTAAAWASGGTYPINAGDITGAGTQTAAICQNGRQYPGPNGAINNTNTYDGSSWTAAPTTNSSLWNRASAKNGTQTSALAVGGTPGPSANSEEYDGSSWSEGPNYPQASQFFDQATGTQTAALASGGYGGPPGSAYLDTTCTYDGSNWTALSSPSNLLDSRFASTMTGTQTAAIMFNGVGGGTKVESWNGSAWSEQADMLTPRTAAGSAGTSTDAIVYGGEGPTNAVEGWDGTSFSTRANMANAVYAHASCGTTSAALATAGFGPSSTATEEFTGETTAANIVNITTS